MQMASGRLTMSTDCCRDDVSAKLPVPTLAKCQEQLVWLCPPEMPWHKITGIPKKTKEDENGTKQGATVMTNTYLCQFFRFLMQPSCDRNTDVRLKCLRFLSLLLPLSLNQVGLPEIFLKGMWPRRGTSCRYTNGPSLLAKSVCCWIALLDLCLTKDLWCLGLGWCTSVIFITRNIG